MSRVIVSELNIYPVKSLRGITLPTINLTATGPQWDRRWMLIDTAGRFISQREEARLCLISAALTPACLQLSVAGQPSIDVAINAQGNSRAVGIWGDQVRAIDCGEQAANWFSTFLRRDCRLVYMPETTVRPVAREFGLAGDSVSFADGFPLLLISEASLAELNRRMDTPIKMAHFRPNIVVSGCEPFAEDRWQKIRINELEFDVVKPCARCVIPSIDPATGDKNPRVLKALASFRRKEGEIYFGQNLIHRGLGAVTLADSLQVLVDS